MAARLAARRLDLDDIGPEIAKQLAAELPGFVREFEDAQTREGSRKVLGVAHRSISSMYGNRSRFAGQNVPSSKPARSSSRL